jgi:hypothetical protein
MIMANPKYDTIAVDNQFDCTEASWSKCCARYNELKVRRVLKNY